MWMAFIKKIRFQILRPYTTEEQIKYIQATVPLAQYAVRHKHLQHAKYSRASAPLSFFPPDEAKVTSFYTPFHFMLIWAISKCFHTAGCTFIYGKHHRTFSNWLPHRQTMNSIRSNGWNSVKSSINKWLILVVGFRAVCLLWWQSIMQVSLCTSALKIIQLWL